LGVEPFLDDVATLQRFAEVALDLARRAADLRDAEEYRREFESKRLKHIAGDVMSQDRRDRRAFDRQAERAAHKVRRPDTK
jgi:hypothetical protein